MENQFDLELVAANKPAESVAENSGRSQAPPDLRLVEAVTAFLARVDRCPDQSLQVTSVAIDFRLQRELPRPAVLAAVSRRLRQFWIRPNVAERSARSQSGSGG
tara:strand:+ start:246 stop:557 length:312 start_codon:yes stop_codon:yes gene_type:complete